MVHRLTRRTALAAGVLVLGLDPLTRTWTASAAGPLDRIPQLDGELVFDQAALEAAADDYGHLVHRAPLAVLRPGSVGDVAAMVGFCRRHGLKVAGRGQGHSTNGQAQVPAGLVIDLGTLDGITLHGHRAVVQAGARWSALLQACLPLGLTPPVLTDYLELSVGGTLSVGGLGGQVGHYGAQVDNVLELQVVTGEGKIATCSPTVRPDLFRAAVGGLGQVAIITRATISMVPAATTARRYNLTYPTVAALTAQQRKLIKDGRFDYVEGQVQPLPAGGWTYLLEAVAYDATPADDTRLIGDLAHASVAIDDLTYFDFLNRIGPVVDILKSLGEWQRPHPWLDSLIPASAVNAVVKTTLAGLDADGIGASAVILLYPILTRRRRTPLPVMPDEELVYLFSVLKTASPGADSAQAMVTANRHQFELVRAAGGTWYPIGSVDPFSQADWRRHFGSFWPVLRAARRRYDPDGVLTPGQRIF
ncbi:MAG: FAD-binding protein [Streptosporangiaceae bacterium]